MRNRAGLSRAEVLVVLAIIGVVVSLILTVAYRLRDLADRSRCKSNLKELGMSVIQHTENRNRLPRLADQGHGAVTGDGIVSPFAAIMPYMGSLPVIYRPGKTPTTNYHAHSSVGFPFQWKDGSSYTQDGGVANQSWSFFLDPSDATADKLCDVPMTLPDGSTGHYAAGSYAVNGRLLWTEKYPLFDLDQSNTILIGERPQVCRPATGDPVYNLWGVGFYSPHMPAFAATTPADPPGLGSTGQVAPVNPATVRIGRDDAEPQPPDFPTPVQMVSPGSPCDPRLPGSPHRSVMQVVMIDGSVRPFAANVEPWVFWSACLPKKSD